MELEQDAQEYVSHPRCVIVAAKEPRFRRFNAFWSFVCFYRFGSLLMSKIDNELQHQDDGHLRTFIKDHVSSREIQCFFL